MENKKNTLTIILIIIIAILCFVIGWLVGSKVADVETDIIDDNKQTKQDQEETKKYTVYTQGQEIKLSDNSDWIVLKDSDEKSDYVVLLSKKDYTPTDNYYSSIENEIYNKDTQYENSSLKQYLNSLESQIPVTLKEVDGYKIRLITIEEIFAFDNNWQYNNESDSYTYTGQSLNENFKGILTMSHTKCTEGKCTAFYNLSETQCLQDSCNKQFFLEHWILGLSGIKPVISVHKDSLVK